MHAPLPARHTTDTQGISQGGAPNEHSNVKHLLGANEDAVDTILRSGE